MKTLLIQLSFLIITGCVGVQQSELKFEVGKTLKNPPVVNPQGPANDRQLFEQTVYPVSSTNCTTCHRLNSVDSYPVAHSSADPSVAYQTVINASNPLVNFTNPGSSKLVTKMRSRHNCGSVTVCENIADQFEAAIIEWKNLREVVITPVISYIGASGTNGSIGSLMTISPTSLSGSGFPILSCTSSPALPAWAIINNSTCVISGTPTGTLAASSFTIRVTNVNGSSTAIVSLSVGATSPSLSYAGATGTAGRVGSAMLVSPTSLINNGSAITSCTSSPALPAGLVINASTCVVSGTPVSSSPSTSYSITARNGAGTAVASLSLSVMSSAPTLSYAGALGVSGTVGIAMSVSPTSLLNNGAVITSCVASPALSSGLSINQTTCVISGTPTAVMNSTAFTVIASNSAGSSAQASVTLSVIAAPAATDLGFFVSTVYQVSRTNCLSCHNGANVTDTPPPHASGNSSIAYQIVTFAGYPLVNFDTIPNSKLVTKARERHNCGSAASCENIATLFEAAISQWKTLRNNNNNPTPPAPPAPPAPPSPPAPGAVDYTVALVVSDRVYVDSMLRKVFNVTYNPAEDCESNPNVTLSDSDNCVIKKFIYMKVEFGGPCDLYALNEGQYENQKCYAGIGSISSSNSNPMRYGLTIKACERLVKSSAAFNAVKTKIFGSTTATAPTDALITKAIDLFIPGETPSAGTLSAFRQLGTRGNSPEESWRLIVQGFCMSPVWQVP